MNSNNSKLSTPVSSPDLHPLYVWSLKRPRVLQRSMSLQDSSKVGFLSEAERFAAPSRVNFRFVSPTAVLIRWIDPVYEAGIREFNGMARVYMVRYREQWRSGAWLYRTAPSPRILVSHLRPSTMYEFSSRVAEGERSGAWCDSIVHRTPTLPGEEGEREEKTTALPLSPPLYTIQSPLPTEPHSVPELLQSTEEPGSGDLMPDMHADELNAIVEELDEESEEESRNKVTRKATWKNNPSPSSIFADLWRVDIINRVLLTPDGNVVYDKQGYPLRLCLSADNEAILTDTGIPVLNSSGDLIYGTVKRKKKSGGRV
uniref:Fibronectin type-III domain-containing protein n=1 Tax=Eptatretus burgeri TaxID=7764 RepID=A0A8C4WYT3_EPTBU